MTTVSFVNLKGGVGKTTSTVNTALELHRRGKRVLVIDADCQHNTTDYFRIEEDDFVMTTAELLNAGAGFWPEAVTQTALEGLDIFPATFELLSCDVGNLRADPRAIGEIRDLCRVLDQDEAYDFCLIDCPPSISSAACVAAILASDLIVIPVKVDAYALNGLRELYAQVHALNELRGHRAEIRCLITLYQAADITRQGEALLRASGVRVYETVIRRTVSVDESTFVGQLSRSCTAGRDYAAFTDELIRDAEDLEVERHV